MLGVRGVLVVDGAGGWGDGGWGMGDGGWGGLGPRGSQNAMNS